MLLFERPVLRAARTYHVSRMPALAFGENTLDHTAGLAVRAAPRYRLLQFDRNFCQEFLSNDAV